MQTSNATLRACCLFAIISVSTAFVGGFRVPALGPLASSSAATSSFLRLRHASQPNTRCFQTASLSMMADSDWYKMEKLEDLDGGAAKYKFSVDVDGQLSKDSYMTVMKDFKKNAKFPGFRPGTIPPFMIPKVKAFVILDCLEKTLGEAVRENGLELASEDNRPTLDDDQVKDLTKNWQDNAGFSYTIEAELKPIEGESKAEESAEDPAEEATA
mmetsp:Transcript_4298/g.8671  ORF Transcript_4298/g.8671 Transcript_4298/m.8671 type:complete len:214 (+) Transcript_4298:30-671(+)